MFEATLGYIARPWRKRKGGRRRGKKEERKGGREKWAKETEGEKEWERPMETEFVG